MEYLAIVSFAAPGELSIYGPFKDQESASAYADFLHDAHHKDEGFEWTTVSELTTPMNAVLTQHGEIERK